MADSGQLPTGRALIDKARTLVDAVWDLPACRSRHQEIERLFEDIERPVGLARAGLLICLVGSTGAGKSTLINALVGQEIAREGVDRPTTCVPTIYAPDDADERDLPRVAQARFVRYRVSADSPWGGHVFVDAPDVNSYAQEHRSVTEALAQAADVLVVVMHHQSVAEASPVEFIDAFHSRRHLVFVLGRCDELPEGSRTRLTAQVRSLAADRWQVPDARVFVLSAKAAQDDPQAGFEFPQLLEYLRSIENASGAAGVRRDSFVGAANRIARLFEEVGVETKDTLAAFENDVDTALHDIRAKVEGALTGRIEQFAGDVESLMRAEAGMQWHGPIGLALRVGAMSRIALGLSGSVLRRSPLLAGAALAASQVCDAQMHAGAAKRLTASVWDETLRSRIADWADEASTRFRLRADRINLGVPSVAESLTGCLQDTAKPDRGARALADTQIAARRALPGWLRWVLDFPVYVLGAWIVFRAVTGLWTNDLVGIDLLVTAGIVAAAWVILVLWIAGRRISTATRSVLDQAAGEYMRQFDTAGREAKLHVLGPAQKVFDALAHLRIPVTDWKAPEDDGLAPPEEIREAA